MFHLKYKSYIRKMSLQDWQNKISCKEEGEWEVMLELDSRQVGQK